MCVSTAKIFFEKYLQIPLILSLLGDKIEMKTGGKKEGEYRKFYFVNSFKTVKYEFCSKINNFVQKCHKSLTLIKSATYNVGVKQQSTTCGEVKCMSYYAKTLLYVYANIEDVIGIIDDMVYRRALSSFGNTEPCEKQAQKILDLISDKDELLYLRLKMEEVFGEFSEFERKHFEYKFWPDMPKGYFDGFDTVSRAYFRRQNRLFSEYLEKLIKHGLTEEFFMKNLYKISFVKSSYNGVKQAEIAKHSAKKDKIKGKIKVKTHRRSEEMQNCYS